MAKIVEVHPKNPQPRSLNQIADCLKDGGLIAYPTDSSYALGALLDNSDARNRIRDIRRLDDKHDFTLVCSQFAQLGQFVHMSNSNFRAVSAATPGQYTFIFAATKEVPRRFQHPKKKTVGVRIPDHKVTHDLLETVGQPLLSSTLLLPGMTEPLVSADEISDAIGNQVDLIVDAGECSRDVTTVISFADDMPEVLRVGAGDPTFFEG